ncbi:MAG: copper chaperone PCu(A)C [Rubrivivax sp.]
MSPTRHGLRHVGLLTLAALLAAAAPARAQTTVQDPWVRATVGQQKASGAFMQLQSARGGKLVSASSPVAGVVEIHEMAMDGQVMRMRAVAALELPAGQPVALRPGGYHVMLMDLKKPLSPGDTVALTLVVETAGQRENVEVKAVVRPLGAQAQAGGGHAGHGHKP